ncbi:MAG: hypothetical protein ABIF77_14540 [bacterium]
MTGETDIPITPAPVVAVRAEGTAPYDQSKRVFLNYSFAPAQGFPVRMASFGLSIDIHLVSGEDGGLWFDYVSWGAVMLSEDTFKIEENVHDEDDGWVRHRIFTGTVEFSNRRITSWYYFYQYDNDETDIHVVASECGGEVNAYWQTDSFAQYEARGQEVIDGLQEISFVRTEGGVVTQQLDTTYCDVTCSLTITIRP